ncbi:MAG: hypothetical protein EPO26_14640 [Chloroflexota bacterium]|nr:MAG: hypothetical protein EPO26_14640 [Chloroflexota bacterium]
MIGPSFDRIDQLEGIVGALAGQVIVLLAQNRALQDALTRASIVTSGELRETTLAILESDLDQLADEILPGELSTSVKASLRQAIEAARSA